MMKSFLDRPVGLVFQFVFLGCWTGAALDVVPPVFALVMLALMIGETAQTVAWRS